MTSPVDPTHTRRTTARTLLAAALAGFALLAGCALLSPEGRKPLPRAQASVPGATDSPVAPPSESPAAVGGTGPLRVLSTNPRYFTDDGVRAVLLTGSHTWSNFQDNGGSDPPPVFDYAAYLDFLEDHNHNFFRLWTWEQSRWTLETPDENYWFHPMPPFVRTGSGTAEDGKPRYDLTQFDQAYFDRLRDRVVQAGERGIYVAVVLFNGWSVESAKGSYDDNNPWRGHPFKAGNNVNGIDGDPNADGSGRETHTLAIPAITAIQEDYVRKVVDTLNDLDNVLFEISNESPSNSQDWQNHMILVIQNYEATLPKQHPVGMTVEWPNGSNAELFASPADWISPNGDLNPPPADGSKVVLADTDHLCGICGDRIWAWKSFTRGENPIFMDGYDGAAYGVGGADFDPGDPKWESLRANLGYIRSYADRMDLAATRPMGSIASTGYALANPAGQDAEYLVFLPAGGMATVDLSGTPGDLMVEWFDPEDGSVTSVGSIAGGGVEPFTPPFSGNAVLYLYSADGPAPSPTPDTQPPVLTEVSSFPLDRMACISWTTDEPATSQVAYGLTAALGLTTTLSAHYVTAHEVTVDGLEPGTTYHFRARSLDPSGNLGETDVLTFTTLAAEAVQHVFLPVLH